MTLLLLFPQEGAITVEVAAGWLNVGTVNVRGTVAAGDTKGLARADVRDTVSAGDTRGSGGRGVNVRGTVRVR